MGVGVSVSAWHAPDQPALLAVNGISGNLDLGWGLCMPVHLLVIPLALSPLPTPSPAVGSPPCPCPRSAGELPTLSDWESHLTTVFPEVRLKRFLEMRGADAGPWRLICGLPALWVGLLYDAQAQVGGWAPSDAAEAQAPCLLPSGGCICLLTATLSLAPPAQPIVCSPLSLPHCHSLNCRRRRWR